MPEATQQNSGAISWFDQYANLYSTEACCNQFAHVIRELHNKLGSVRVLIGSQLWSVKGQMLPVARLTTAQLPLSSTALDSSLTAAWFLWTNQNALIRKATTEFASFCINNRFASNGYFHEFLKMGKSSARFRLKKQNLFDLFQIHSILPCVCSVIEHRK